VTDIDQDMTLGELVDRAPAAARVLQGFGLDFCCGGARPLAAACGERGVEVAAVVAALDDLAPGPAAEWAGMDTRELVDHIETTHHAYLHAELPRLDALAEKVAGVHGGRHPELLDVLADFRELTDELVPHLAKEERILFPMIRRLAAGEEAEPGEVPTVAAPISVMVRDHDRAGELLAELRARTADFAVPEDGCASYRALYAGLEELEIDTHLHVHKENNVLFPAVLALESQATP
jgi:regulator of cell morphogenesis and NO signaling